MNNENNKVTSALETLLKQKVNEAIGETRKQVAAEIFGVDINEAAPSASAEARKPHPQQASFNKHWAGADDEKKKKLKKIAWNQGFDIPDMSSKGQSASKSPIHSFAAEAEKTPAEIKAEKKKAWQNDERMPWPKQDGKKSRSPIHDFSN